MPDPGSLTDLLARKEKELHNIYGTLEQTLKDKDQECQDLRVRFKSLQDDFVYNLQLLEERDKELERYDMTTEELRIDIAERETRINEHKSLLNEKTYELSQLKTLLQTQEQQHNDAIRRLRREQEQLEQQHELALSERSEAFEQTRMDLQLELKAAKQQQDLQREAFTAEIDKLKRQSEIDLQLCKQEINQQLLDAEHRVASAFADLNAVKMRKEASENAYQQQLEMNKKLEKRLKDYQWERADGEKTAAAKIAELEEMVQQLKSQNASQAVAFEEDRARLLSDFAAKEQDYQKNQETSKTRLNETQSQLNTAKQEMVDRTAEFKKRIEDLQKAIREKDHMLRETCTDFERQILKWEEDEKADQEEIAQQANVINSLKTRMHASETELAELRRDVATYKQEIAKRVEAEMRLQKSAVEQRAEWERKFEELKRRKLRDQDEIIKGLIMAKERAEAESKLLRERWRSTQAAEGLRRSPGGDGAMAMEELEMPPFDNEFGDEIPNERDADLLRRHNARLQEQNQQLTTIVHQMRQDMEQLQQAMDSVTEQQGGHDIGHTARNDSPTAPETEMYHQEAVHLHKQISNLQSLLQQKQSIIDQLLQQQEKMHQQMEREVQKKIISKPSKTKTKRRRGRAEGSDDDLDDSDISGDESDEEGPRSREKKNALKLLRSTNYELRDKLRSAVEDLMRAVAEKSRLVDLSNMLQSELRMVREELERGKERERERVWRDGKDPPKDPTPDQQQQQQQQQAPVVTGQRVTSGYNPQSRKVAVPKAKISIGKTMVKPTDGRGGVKIVEEVDMEQLKRLKLRERGVRNWNDKDDELA
ncbi:Coiled-coil domain-containing protein 57 [Rhizophlyctis rosea]|uniref:Coiled-coil domain-containing protein 57 n=1 Tax=Rhizophlyctis rosea TaxID=64517 RepID=A0AAD5X5D3_9FUNG|nr:Coiled-coil domain-containing protein 57 [Rhizophlyctis rosea]